MIPKELLIHTATLKHISALDRNRNPEYTATTLANVRISATLATANGQQGAEKSDALTLFIDAENTMFYDAENGQEVEAAIPQEQDRIVWNGRNYEVKSVTPCHTDSAAVHHWEIGLV